MKKTALFLLLLFSISLSSYAQLQRHDISLSGGLFSSNFYDAVSYDIFTDQDLDNIQSKNIGEQTGALYLSYKFFPNSKFSLGATIGFERVKGTFRTDDWTEGQYYNDYVSGGVEFDYRYISRGKFQLYSGIGAGIMFNEEENEVPGLYFEFDESFNFAYQLNLIGARYGGVFGGFIELGYGYKGLVKAGISIQL